MTIVRIIEEEGYIMTDNDIKKAARDNIKFAKTEVIKEFELKIKAHV